MAKIFIAELFGTFSLVLIGAGAVAIGEAVSSVRLSPTVWSY